MRKTAVCVVVLGLAACAGLFGPVWASRLGSIDQTLGPVAVPDTVAVNTSFLVSFTTSGGGCHRMGNTQVTMVDSRTAEIRGYDDYQVNPSVCNAIQYHFHHTATVRFAQAGISTVRLIGAYNDSTITITRAVVVM
jgi:hypothetical protein